MEWKISTLVLVLFTTPACSLVERSSESGYAYSENEDHSWRRSSSLSDETSQPRTLSNPNRETDAYERKAKKMRDQLGMMMIKRREFASVIEQKDIALGMDKDSVRESWGDPVTIDVAGNPSNQNERWHYVEYVSSQDGYLEQHRVVYFKRGEVVGWQTE